MNQHRFDTIGIVHSCYPEKFGTPRQPGLVPEAEADVEILPPYNQHAAFRGLERFSHIWILFVFHHCNQNDWKPSVRPPRLGGNQKIGVFATRSGFRPNPIGQSVVGLRTIQYEKGAVRLRLKGVDLVDGTPVVDIKPYVAYCDRIAAAQCAYANAAPGASKRVVFTPLARAACHDFERRGYPTLGALITHTLELDPRPGYKSDNDQRQYGLALWDLDIAFRTNADTIVVEHISCTDKRLGNNAQRPADPHDAPVT